MDNHKDKQVEAFRHKTFIMMFRLLFIFGVPAVIGFFVGQYFDTTYDMRPAGSLIALGIAFVTSWILVVRMYVRLERERKVIDTLPADQEVSEKKN